MKLPDNITAAVLAYRVVCLTKRACCTEYEQALSRLGENPGGEEMAAIEEIGRRCDTTRDAKLAAQWALLQAIECMEIK